MNLFSTLFCFIGCGKEGKTGVSTEALARKERSHCLLKQENIPINEFLPVIESGAESKRRSTQEVARRAIALCVVAVKGEGLEQALVQKIVDDYHIESDFTPDELKFINNLEPTEHIRAQFCWRYESYWVLLWALGYVEKLEQPSALCDVEFATKILKVSGPEAFVKNAKLRPQRELLDAADLIYRYHWAVRNARLKGEECPDGLNPDVVMERHHVLNWLIGYCDYEWDDVTTDT